MTDLVEWLETAIASVEADAIAYRGVWPRPSIDDAGFVWLHIKPGGNAVIVRYPHPDQGYRDMADLRNWASVRSGATREAVLRRCAADRKLIAEVRRAEWISKNTGDTAAVAVEIGLRSALKIVAEGYDYQEATVNG
jgi:hypothetical protein